MTCKLCNDTGEQRYWEGRWRDEKAENERLRKPLNCQIAEALGWSVWEDPRNPGRWFQEGREKIMPVLDYVGILRDDVKMHQGGRPDQQREDTNE